MDKNLARWIFQSLASHFKSVADGITLLYFVEGIDERSNDTMQENHVELRVTGPELKEVSKGYYNVKVVVNFLFTKNMDEVGADAFDLIQWTGVFADEMLEPIPIYKKGSGVEDDGALVGCLQVHKGRNDAVRVFHFGQLDKDTRIRQSEVDAMYGMNYQSS
jgi:hypothetical protein